jgi:hypothetical protein
MDPRDALRLSRRGALAAIAATGLLGTGCFLSKPPELTPDQVIAKASDALKTVNAAHFKVESTKGMMAIGTGLVARTIEGDVVKPDRLQGKAASTFGRVTVEISFIFVSGQGFITNPITKKWEVLPGAGRATNLLDPNRGASLLLTKVTKLKKLANESVSGVDCYHLAGDVDASLVAGLVGGTASIPTLSGDLWIGSSDFLLRQIHLVGPVSTNEPPEIERVLSLSNFNESVTINSPL